MDFPVVIKADGLCAGKGVFIEQDLEAAEATLTDILVDGRFGDQGEKVVIEEFLDGVEQSLLCFVSNNRIIPMETAQDYKKMGEGDTGLNTGGIGAYSPSRYINDKISESISKIIAKIEKGGLLFTFSCSQAVDKAQFQSVVMAAAIETGRKARILYQLSQPEDHPINIYHPEGAYLKGIVLQID